MKRFEKMRQFEKIENIEKFSEAQKLLLYEQMFKAEKKREYDINEWNRIYRKINNDYVPIVYKHNKLNYYLNCRENIFSYIYKSIKYLLGRNDSILFNNGIHLISGYPGAGKTLLSNYIIRSVDKKKYFFYTNKKQYEGENIEYLPMESIFDEKKQIASIPIIDSKGRKLYGIIFDEINLQFNRRENRTREYSNMFMGLVEFMVSHRHQGIPRLYFLGQKLELQDTQIQSLIMYHHYIKRRKNKLSYQLFKETGYINSVPKKLVIENYVKTESNEFEKVKKSKIKISRYVLGTYNTKHLGETYSNLPKFVDNSTEKSVK